MNLTNLFSGKNDPRCSNTSPIIMYLSNRNDESVFHHRSINFINVNVEKKKLCILSKTNISDIDIGNSLMINIYFQFFISNFPCYQLCNDLDESSDHDWTDI